MPRSSSTDPAGACRRCFDQPFDQKIDRPLTSALDQPFDQKIDQRRFASSTARPTGGAALRSEHWTQQRPPGGYRMLAICGHRARPVNCLQQRSLVRAAPGSGATTAGAPPAGPLRRPPPSLIRGPLAPRHPTPEEPSLCLAQGMELPAPAGRRPQQRIPPLPPPLLAASPPARSPVRHAGLFGESRAGAPRPAAPPMPLLPSSAVLPPLTRPGAPAPRLPSSKHPCAPSQPRRARTAARLAWPVRPAAPLSFTRKPLPGAEAHLQRAGAHARPRPPIPSAPSASQHCLCRRCLPARCAPLFPRRPRTEARETPVKEP
jgi:hypothetical protein